MNIKKAHFGRLPSGEEVSLYTLANSSSVTLTITDFGGRMVNLLVPGRDGKTDDIIPGFDSLDGYLVKNPYFGALVGRCANRIKNSRFPLNGKEYILDSNADPHHLHGGKAGFSYRLWDSEITERNGLSALKLSLFSADGDQGYPGNLWVTVWYTLDEDSSLSIEYEARTDQDTIVNLTNHNYFNLNGHQNGSVLNHSVWIASDYITDLDGDKIADGTLLAVKDTPFDFNTPHRIGERAGDDHRLLRLTEGYDVNYVLAHPKGDLSEKVCTVTEEESGRSITVYTTLPAMQFYTANYINGNHTGKGGVIYRKNCGLCLETQYNPNSPNCPEFPSITLRAGEEYHSQTIYHFDF